MICEPVRTPIGRFGGMLQSLSVVDLGAAALKGLLKRTGIAPDAVPDVIVGHCHDTDEHPRADTTVESLSKLKAVVDRGWRTCSRG